MMKGQDRQSTGIAALDRHLGGGLLPGRLTVVLGATGIGKTQLGLQFARAGSLQEGRPGMILDLTARGDSQHHAEYARRMFGWQLEPAVLGTPLDLERLFDVEQPAGDYLHAFELSGRRPSRREVDFDLWHDWQAELARRLHLAVGFCYGGFIRGARRLVIDWIEPVEQARDSVQLELAEYIYHQVLHKEADWVARDLLREKFRAHARQVQQHLYDPQRIGCLVLITSRETSLDALIERPLDEGDLLSGANTVILLGKVREGRRFARAMFIAKHRGSPATDQIIPYQIDEQGIRLAD